MSLVSDVEVILVGSELLKGERADAHLAYLGRAVRRFGARVAEAVIVVDSVELIAEAVRERLGRARFVVVAGGLGPTPDDVTREGVAAGVGVPLEFDGASWDHIQAYFQRRGRTATDVNRRQAHFPAGAHVLENAHGTAPGFSCESKGTTVFVLPGPPHEMQRMFESGVAPRMGATLGQRPLRVETFRTFGVGESKLMEQFGELLGGLSGYDVSSLPWVTGVDVILTERRDAAPALLDDEAVRVEKTLREKLGTKLYEHGERTLAEVTGALLADRGETLAVAESLTGGMIATLLTDVAGSSAYLLAGVVTYSNESKVDLLGVDVAAIERDGAVSQVVCEQMARGVRQRCDATWALSTTGIAGPTGATPEKPVGLTYLGVAGDGEAEVIRRVFQGERDDVRRKASFGAIWILFDKLVGAQGTRA